jgi:hypothetical protein
VRARRLVAAATLFAALAAAAPSRATVPPVGATDWPCQQRLVPELAAATYWNGSMPDNLGEWRADPAVADLVRRLAPRRVSTEEGLRKIAAFARNTSSDRQRRLALVFRGLLDESNSERARLIEGLEEIGRRQHELADLVARLATELAAVPPDATGEAAARRADLQQRHDFTARNFEEIQRTIRYACEIPVALDARLGAWARELQRAASR